MEKRFYAITVLISFTIVLFGSSVLAVPLTINYQGKLTDPNGSVLNGEYQMYFSLFETETGGPALWNEQQAVMITEGIYNVRLGSVVPLFVNIFTSDSLYLEVSIESEILQPRHPLTSVAFALRAKDAETVRGVTITEAITTHSSTPDAHHTKTTSFTELVDMATDAQIPDDITVNHALNTDMVDGKHAVELGSGDGHSLDAADGDPVDALYVDNNSNVGIGTINPLQKLSVSGIIESINGGFKFPDGTVQTTAINDGTYDVYVVNSINRLRKLTVTVYKKIAVVTGYWTDGDGGGGVFYWDAEEPAENDDGGTIIHPDISGEYGCWRRLYSVPINVKWFGAKGDGTTNDTCAFQKALNCANGRTVLFDGDYLITNTLTYYNSDNCEPDINVDPEAGVSHHQGFILKGYGQRRSRILSATSGQPNCW